MKSHHLYDAFSVRIYSYCWALLGPEGAAEATRDAFDAAARRWSSELIELYELARKVCRHRGAFGPTWPYPGPDPLLRAAAHLTSEQREVLALSTVLEPRDIGKVVGIPSSSVREEIREARDRLEKSLLEEIWPGPISEEYDEVLVAFEQGKLVQMLYLRSGPPPVELRSEVMKEWRVTANSSTEIPIFEPVPDEKAEARFLAGFAVAASVAAVVCIMVLWPDNSVPDAPAPITQSSAPATGGATHTPAPDLLQAAGPSAGPGPSRAVPQVFGTSSAMPAIGLPTGRPTLTSSPTATPSPSR